MLNAAQNPTHCPQPANATQDLRANPTTSSAAAGRAGPVQAGPPAVQLARSLRRLDRWLGFSRFTQREWSGRLPAVAAAGVTLTAYAWGAGFEPLDLRLTLLLGLAAAVVGLHSDSK